MSTECSLLWSGCDKNAGQCLLVRMPPVLSSDCWPFFFYPNADSGNNEEGFRLYGNSSFGLTIELVH